MQTDSSASFTYLASVSACEWTTTVLMPSSRQARWIRSAISPRLAIRIFSNMSFDHEQRLTVLDRRATLDEDLADRARLVGFDLVHQLHGFDDAQRIAFLDLAADPHERIGGRVGRAV